MMTTSWHAGDTTPPLSGTAMGKVRADYPLLTDDEFNRLAPVPVDLSDATAAVVHVHRSGGNTIIRAATKGDQIAAKGSWSMPWSVGDLDFDGDYSVELETTWPDGGIRTFGPTSFLVARQIA